jgi:hypothetical protein
MALRDHQAAEAIPMRDTSYYYIPSTLHLHRQKAEFCCISHVKCREAECDTNPYLVTPEVRDGLYANEQHRCFREIKAISGV